MKNIDLKCDNPKCDWKTIDDPCKWHNKQCPKCNDCIIINDNDMAVIKAVETLEKAGLCVTGEKAKQGKGLKVQIDTSKLR